MTGLLRFALSALVGAAALAGAGCASTADDGPNWVVVEERAEIDDRRFIRRLSVLDDDELLIEERPGRYYRVRLLPACVSIADILSSVRIEETSIGIDRTTRFIVGGRRCGVRSIERVERVLPGAADAAPADEEAAPPQGEGAAPAPEA